MLLSTTYLNPPLDFNRKIYAILLVPRVNCIYYCSMSLSHRVMEEFFNFETIKSPEFKI